MSHGDKISPSNTYVIDEDVLDEMDSIELTGLLDELSEQLVDGEANASPDEDSTPDAESADEDAETLDLESDDRQAHS